MPARRGVPHDLGLVRQGVTFISEPAAERELIVVTVRGAPSWITPEVVEDTLKTFRPHYGEKMTPQDALEFLLNVGQLFELLDEKPKSRRESR